MKIQQIQQIQQQQNMYKQQETPQFKGVIDTTFRFLATNQGVGANLTDLGFMVVPRVATDAKRGPAACMETFRREISGTLNHTLVGAYGFAAGALTAALIGMGRNFDVKANRIFAAPETVNILAEFKTNQIKNNTSQVEYLEETLRNLKAFNPASVSADKEGYVKLSEKTVKEVANILDKSINKGNIDNWKNEKSVNSFYTAINKIVAETGAESRYILNSSDGKIQSETNLKTLLTDVYRLSDSFNKKDVQEAFKEQVKNNVAIKDNNFIKKFTKFSKTRSIAGVAIATAIGMSIQPLNIYLTKKKTGSDGFVGVEGRSKDHSTGFKFLKGLASAGFLGLTLTSLGTVNPKKLMEKMAFKGGWPTIPQLKGIYGLTIISRLIATRDKDELRESFTKDTLGFLSWLVLGDIVNKMTADSINKSVMNRTKDVAGKKFFSRVFNSSLKTRDEVLIETLAHNGIDVVKENGIAKTFKEMRKDVDKLPKQIQEVTKKRLRTLNVAQGAGYLFSGLVLGFGIPNLNIYITNKLDKKRKAQAAAEQAKQAQVATV